MNKKHLKTVILPAIISVLFTACANNSTSTDPYEKNAEDYGVGNFIQWDESKGEAYVINEDGTKEYVNETDSEDDEDAINFFQGEYFNNGIKLNINEDWHAIDNGSDLKIVSAKNSDSKDFISIATFENTEMDFSDDWTAERLNSSYDKAVEDGIYKAVTFIESNNNKIKGYDAFYYKCNITSTSDTNSAFSVYIIYDDFGGHVIMANNEEDDVNVQDELDYVIKNIEFTNTENTDEIDDIDTSFNTPESSSNSDESK